MEPQIPTVTIDDLRAFHAKHFPHAPMPKQFLHGVSQDDAEAYYEEEDDGLGYYPDGTKRTLTDEQIAMFRHSEIQAILRKRRLQREGGEASEEGEAMSDTPYAVEQPPPAPTTALASAAASPAPGTSAAQPPKQQWATSSARTKARNKRHRDKYRMKKKEIRERKGRTQPDERGDEDEESDEWDPWHQANGPDAQKDDTLDLDY